VPSKFSFVGLLLLLPVVLGMEVFPFNDKQVAAFFALFRKKSGHQCE